MKNIIIRLKKLFKSEPKFIGFPKNGSWMLNEDFSPNIKNLKKCKEFYALMKTKQSPKWHGEGDAFKHTVLVAKKMYEMVNSGVWFLNNRDKRILMLAAICHDLGKATTTYFDEKEKDWKCKNHGVVGERITRELLFDEDINTREEICWLVRWHMNFHHVCIKPYQQRLQEITRLSKGQSTIEKLLILNVADSRGSLSVENTEDKINDRLRKISDIAMSNDCYIKPYHTKNTESDYTMYVMIGLPGSGKDTYIHKYLQDLPCICRDDIREEIKDGQIIGRKLMLSPLEEKQVTDIVNERIRTCCINKQSFVINQTSLKKKYRQAFIDIAEKFNHVNIVYVYVEAPSIEDCIRRRGEGKWKGIINRMWDEFEFPDKSECNKLIIYKQS